ncbi:MAG: enoyl-CoA hydratase [Candidatus Latescibacteria bacterium]|jgi:enoyl-CoA hydratase/carnithine racemase|nr:enoyl-CoA hydratase [Candidatus Latescibacterota bacterium]
MTEKVIVQKNNGVGSIILNQPEKHNAISYEMWQGIAEALGDFESDDEVRVIVLSGEGGRAFSAGADISQFEEKRGSADAVETYNAVMGQTSQKLTQISKPTLAKITGYCIGGGLATALNCDLRIASDDSQFGIPAAKLGLGYGYGGLKPLVSLVGPANAREILFTARRFTASEAYDMGLVNRVLSRDELDAFIDDYTETIAGNAPLTIKACKKIIAEITKNPDERDLDLCKQVNDACFDSDDYKEGRTAFMEKRKPNFQGR